MALSQSGLKGRIVSAMESQGAKASGEHSWVEKMADAIASAVIDEITSNAEVQVTGGSSAGTYKVN
jgi:hypothetical protein